MPERFPGDDADAHDESATEREARSAAIREANDTLRRSVFDWAVHGKVPRGDDIVQLTRGVDALPNQTKLKMLAAIRDFEAFTPDCDPYDEHQMGVIEVDGAPVMFWFDYYDRRLEYGSPDPADPRLTRRVMTIMLPEER